MSEEPIAASIDPAKGESETVWNIVLNGEIIGQAKTEEMAKKLSSLYQLEKDREDTSDKTRRTTSGSELYNARDWDAKISVPYHCFVRMLNALSYSGMVISGSALERDCLMTKQLINDELKRTRNIQG